MDVQTVHGTAVNNNSGQYKTYSEKWTRIKK